MHILVVLVCLVMDHLDQVVIIPHDGLRIIPILHVVKASYYEDIHAPFFLIVLNFPGFYQVYYGGTRDGYVVNVF